MRLIAKEEQDGKTVLVVESKLFFIFPRVRKFIAEREIAGEYFSWLELPEKTLVPDHLSFQLDAWKRN